MTSIGEVNVSGINISPNEVSPEGVVRINVELYESAEFVGPLGELRTCDPDGWNLTGLEVDVIVEPSWSTRVVETVCVPVWNVGTGEVEVEFELTAPSETGTHTVSSMIRSTKTGETSSPVQNQFVVSTGEGAKDEPRDGGDNDGGGFSLLSWVNNNPAKTVVAVGGGYVVVKTVSETATEEIL